MPRYLPRSRSVGSLKVKKQTLYHQQHHHYHHPYANYQYQHPHQQQQEEHQHNDHCYYHNHHEDHHDLNNHRYDHHHYQPQQEHHQHNNHDHYYNPYQHHYDNNNHRYHHNNHHRHQQQQQQQQQLQLDEEEETPRRASHRTTLKLKHHKRSSFPCRRLNSSIPDSPAGRPRSLLVSSRPVWNTTHSGAGAGGGEEVDRAASRAASLSGGGGGGGSGGGGGGGDGGDGGGATGASAAAAAATGAVVVDQDDCFLCREQPQTTLSASDRRRCKGKRNKGLSVSSPELRSMLESLNTTVPQNLHPLPLPTKTQPKRHFLWKPNHFQSIDMACCSCCSCRAFVVFMQIFLGLALTGVCVYLHMFMPVVRMREKPFWAGVPLLLAGVFGIGFLFNSKIKEGSGSSCLFVVKMTSAVSACIAIFTCVTSLVFIIIHMVRLFTFAYCRHLPDGCMCFKSYETPASEAVIYTPVDGCFPVFCQMKIFIGCIGGLCLLGSVIALTFVVSVWRSVYGNTSSEPTSPADDMFPRSPSKFSHAAARSRPDSSIMSASMISTRS